MNRLVSFGLFLGWVGLVACSSDEVDTKRVNVEENLPDASMTKDASLVIDASQAQEDASVELDLNVGAQDAALAEDMQVDMDTSNAPDAGGQTKFAGHWALYDDSARGGISLSIYLFDASGSVERGATQDDRVGQVFCDSSEAECPMKQMLSPCEIGPRWRYVSEDQFQVSLSCEDKQDRQALVSLVPSALPQGPLVPGERTPKIVEVNGESTSAWSFWAFADSTALMVSCKGEAPKGGQWDPCREVRGK